MEPDWLITARARGLVVGERGVTAIPGAVVRRGPTPLPPPAGCSESVFQGHVNALCSWGGWEWFHHLRSKGTNAGFPDLITLRSGAQGVAAELKVRKNQPTEQQLRVLELFRQMGFRTFVWRPADWEQIVEVLA